jgi:ABC transporter substrate binding protein (PQQ-dependent alcohol dehydrogenase system)
LTQVVLEAQADPLPAFENLLKQGIDHVLVNVPAEQIVALQRAVGSRPVLVFDVASRDDRLRAEDCADNVLHTLPSRAMLADALGQYLLQKRWMKWFVVVGAAAGDALFAAAVERSAKRFGAKIVARKPWEHSFDERRTAASEVPVFTQDVDYDVLVVADEQGAFGDELSYRTWLPRPVVGTQGLVAAGWHPVHETWGAIQLQNRFREKAGRAMREVDYGAWLAVRAIGEAATRAHSVQFAAIRDYVLSEPFALAGFKGVPLSFRSWDRQLRQPVLLAQPRGLVAVAPVEGIIHPKNELDTLGYDESESGCRLPR